MATRQAPAGGGGGGFAGWAATGIIGLREIGQIDRLSIPETDYYIEFVEIEPQ